MILPNVVMGSSVRGKNVSLHQLMLVECQELASAVISYVPICLSTYLVVIPWYLLFINCLIYILLIFLKIVCDVGLLLGKIRFKITQPNSKEVSYVHYLSWIPGGRL